jgi:hypothetical protein
MLVTHDDLVAAARELIRSEGDGCVVSIWELLDELSDKFGDRFGVSPDTDDVLRLIETLWADPEIHQVPDGWIEFGWNGGGFDEGPGPRSFAMLRDVLAADFRKEVR